ncbi:MAG: hypothetical protein Q9184_000816 [Pyrenodesmia sp. 2 TL-2023]
MAEYIDPTLTKSTRLANGITYSYIFVPPSGNKPYILFLHGFPSSAYDWRRQVPFFRDAGYGVVAPDLLGYGGTDKPTELEPYSLKSISDNIASLLDHLEIREVAAVGHDWGSFLLSRLANYHPERISAYAFLNTGYKPPLGKFDVDVLNDETERTLGYPIFGYWHFFNSPDGADIMTENPATSRALYASDPQTLLHHLCPKGATRKFYEEQQTRPLPAWMPENEALTHSRIFSADSGGYRGGCNWYKAQMGNINAADEEAVPAERRRIEKPTLLVTCTDDCVAVPVMQEGQMREFAVGGMEVREVKAGHWVQLEKAEEVNAILKDFFERCV